MNGQRHGAAALALGVCLAMVGGLAPGRAGAAEIKRSTERTFDLAPGGTLTIDNQNGRVTVEGWDQPRARVQIVRVVRATDAEKAEAYLRALRAEIDVGGNRLTITSRYPKRKESVGFWDLIGQRIASAQIHYYVQVPRETRLNLATTNGPVRVRGTRGDLQTETTNGGIDISSVVGAVAAHTTNGSIELSDVDGTAKGETTNGGVTAVLRGLEGGGVDLATTNGSIEVYLPDPLRASLDATTTNGKVYVSFPLTTQGVMTSKSVRGTIGGGGAKISLLTTNGNIDVRRLRERESEH
jgi:hypothetical protein